MFEHECVLNEFMVQYLNSLVADIDEADMDMQPCDGFNPPRWILGHLAIYTDYALRATGARFQCPKDWHRNFARGSTAGQPLVDTPTKDELVDKIISGFRLVRERSRQMEPDAVETTHSVPFLKSTSLATVGHVISHLMTTHLAAHLGQLSSWRRIRGRSPVEPARPVDEETADGAGDEREKQVGP